MLDEQEKTGNSTIEYLKSFDFNIDKLSYKKKELAHMLINRIYVTDEKIKIDWNFSV